MKNLQRLILSATRGLMFCLLMAGRFAAAQELNLVRGASTRLSPPSGVKSFSVTDEKVVDARPAADGQSLLLTGVEAGASEVRVVPQQGAELVYQVFVRNDLAAAMKEVKALLARVEGIELKEVGNKILIDGKILSMQDNERIKKIMQGYPGLVLNTAQEDWQSIYGILQEVIKADIACNTVDVKIVNDTVVLQGEVPGAEDMDRAVKMASLRLPKVMNLLHVREENIELDVQFLQVNTDKGDSRGMNVLEALGVGMQTGFGGGGTGRPKLSYGISASTSAGIHALLASGVASNAFQAYINTTTGQEGYTRWGGTDYVPVSGNVGGDLKTIDYGTFIKVKPSLRRADSIQLETALEVSVPTSQGGNTRALSKLLESKGTVVCKLGQSVILSGFGQSLGSQSAQRTPFMGSVPLLELFFSTQDKSRGHHDVIAVITPRITRPQANPAAPFSEQGAKLLQAHAGRK